MQCYDNSVYQITKLAFDLLRQKVVSSNEYFLSFTRLMKEKIGSLQMIMINVAAYSLNDHCIYSSLID